MPIMLQRRADRQRVLRDLVAADVGQLRHRQRAQLHALAAAPGLMVSAL